MDHDPRRAPAYTAVADRFRRIGVLGSVQSLLDWDTATMMPRGAAGARAEQQAVLAAIAHREACDPAIGELLTRAEAEALGPPQRANLHAMRRRWLHATAVPEDLVEDLTRSTTECELVWRDARKANDFAMLRPHLERVLVLVRRKGEVKAAALGMSPYEALLDEFNPGLPKSEVDRTLGDLERELPLLLRDVLKRQGARPAPFAAAAADRQHQLGKALMEAVGFDFERGRLDESLHPFMSGGGDDIRITTRSTGEDFISGMLAVAHETGHALYESGLPATWRWQPAGDAPGMAMHEGQALLWEMQVARGRDFLGFLAPLVQRELGVHVAAADLVRSVQYVEPGMIRVDADEVTYPLHILLRYRVERALFAGDLAIADLPAAWNAAMRDFLGVVPNTEAEGCMQDIHWMMGSFGYFPSYALGAVAAAQLFQAAERETPAIRQRLAQGDGTLLLQWLRTNVHAHGSLLPTVELLRQATGRGFDAGALVAHLRCRYVDRAT